MPKKTIEIRDRLDMTAFDQAVKDYAKSTEQLREEWMERMKVRMDLYGLMVRKLFALPRKTRRLQKGKR